MKLNYLLISALALISLNSFSQNGFEDFDDIYSDNTSGTKNSDANTTNNATEFSDGEDAGAWIENDEYYDPSYNAKTNSDSIGNTYITNNYYGDYEYSSRFRRFDNRISGYSYFDPFYTNVGYYSPNAWGYGRNFRRPGWNMGWSSCSGRNVGYNYGWNNYGWNNNGWNNNGWNNNGWGNNGWGNNGWGNNGWGNNGWGNNGYAYNQGFRDGVYASNGDNNNRSRYYGRIESRGAGTRLSSTYGNRRSNSRTINSSGITQNTNTYAGRQSAGNSIRTARPARATMRSVGAPVRRTSPARSSTTRVGDKSPSVISAKPSRALRTSSTPSSKRTGVTVIKERAVPTRPSTTPKRRSIGKPSRRTVGSSPSRTTPSRGIPTRTIPSRTSPRRTTPLRTAPTRTSPTRTSPSRTTPGRSRPTRTSPSRNSGSSRSSGSSRTSSPSRSSSSPSRSSSSGSSRGSSSSRGGRR